MSFTSSAVLYLQSPSPEHFDELRHEVRAAPNYRSDLSAEAVALPLIERQDYQGVISQLHALMPGAFLSPGTHSLLSVAYRERGQAEAADREEGLARAAMHGILSSGDGSKDNPWLVLRISDEYDVLRALGKSSQQQSLIQREGRLCDRHRCDDGSDVWFDISILYNMTPATLS